MSYISKVLYQMEKLFIDVKCVDCKSTQSGLYQFVNGHKSINQFYLSVQERTRAY